MLTNLAIWLILALLMLGAFWSARRAWTSSRGMGIRVAGTVGASLLALALCAVLVVSAKGMSTMYLAQAVPVPAVRIAGTPGQLARGEYLVRIACVGCHGDEKLPLTGGLDFASEVPFPIGKLVAENIAPDGKISEYSDGEIFRVLRHGIGKDGRYRALMMGMPYRQLGDEDLMAIIAYLRRSPPSNSAARGGDHLNLIAMAMLGAGLIPQPDPPTPGVITAPALGRTATYGRYVATFGECRGCHGPELKGEPAGVAGPATPNLRATLPTWTREQFVQAMRTGKRPDG
ncbi:MAG: cytochrome c, partial [Gemmatimonadota bacterium]